MAEPGYVRQGVINQDEPKTVEVVDAGATDPLVAQ